MSWPWQIKDIPLDYLYYMATPFTHEDPLVEGQRLKDAQEAARRLLRDYGYKVISPIAYTVPLVGTGNAQQWTWFDAHLLKNCDALLVYQMDGWVESQGVSLEIRQAQLLEKPTYYLCPTDIGLKESRWLDVEMHEAVPHEIPALTDGSE